MIPRILEYDPDNGRIGITAEAFAIPELNAIIKKYKSPEAYLSYVNAMSHPESRYINIPESQKKESAIYDIQMTLGEFNFSDPLLDKAIEKQVELYSTKLTRFADQLEEELQGFTDFMKNNPLNLDNAQLRQDIMKNASKYTTECQKVRKQADEALGAAVKGDHEIGEY